MEGVVEMRRNRQRLKRQEQEDNDTTGEGIAP